MVYAAAPGEKPGHQRRRAAQAGLDAVPGRNLSGANSGRAGDGSVVCQRQRQHMARYPNYDPQAAQFNGSAADAIAPERVARWADPAGGYIHAMHDALWGDMHWRILGKKPTARSITKAAGKTTAPAPCTNNFASWKTSARNSMRRANGFTTQPSRTLLFHPARRPGFENGDRGSRAAATTG